METLIITMSLAEVMNLPGEAAIALLRKSDASPETLAAAREMETKGKGRWIVLNTLRNWQRETPPTANSSLP